VQLSSLISSFLISNHLIITFIAVIVRQAFYPIIVSSLKVFSLILSFLLIILNEPIPIIWILPSV